ncbi:hypothetical protein P280DRAFT_144870 [Massarina eburnea CBS 473.64]|uniref:F-box domain-containing protein n=1 Tax=Massarina eburnea CBS 473.64 TaxID=1395130 RepID=A0A6A6RP48_9PLEO|nr:hypothetical protein P280DRAFT_144870 [Massarina eburnea CBS 473.64]
MSFVNFTTMTTTRVSRSESFPFFHLPVELQLRVLQCDPFATLLLIRASQSAKALYLEHPGAVLNAFLNSWPLDLRKLITIILDIRQGPDRWPELDQVRELLVEPSSSTLGPLSTEPRTVNTLELLCTLFLDLQIVTELFCKETLYLATCSFKAPCPDPNEFPYVPVLSTHEQYRINRALLRLIGTWEYVAQSPHPGNKRTVGRSLLNNFTAWEYEELSTMTAFLGGFCHTDNRRVANTCPKSFLRDCTLLLSPIELLSANYISPWPDVVAGSSLIGGGARYVQNFLLKREILTDRFVISFTLHQSRYYGLALWDSYRLRSWESLPKNERDAEFFTLPPDGTVEEAKKGCIDQFEARWKMNQQFL